MGEAEPPIIEFHNGAGLLKRELLRILPVEAPGRVGIQKEPGGPYVEVEWEEAWVSLKEQD
jgi:hypothetical protein